MPHGADARGLAHHLRGHIGEVGRDTPGVQWGAGPYASALELPPAVQLSMCVNNLKTVSSRLLRKAYEPELARWYRQPVLWSRSYCMLTCGGAPLSVLRQYMAKQWNPAS